MYVETARSSNAAASLCGRTKYPVRTPGATVFENDDVYVTSSPPSSSSRLGGAAPSNRTSPYGSSSSTESPCSRTISTSRARRSAESVRPLGFWKVGIV